ncbi:dephospho-CoA kinase domain-containing protein isoform X2 [Nycticebus coucang]|uniref:dephospho-CoA kinase domain-containing protein isoform X2 n=1 Tax=Nycticebus coucang TaxID=9470 RepID=UPI00234C595D|nr:dephospho-CoA kinase domain-containing protein isoform X2 [Nycticebus coucang]
MFPQMVIQGTKRGRYLLGYPRSLEMTFVPFAVHKPLCPSILQEENSIIIKISFLFGSELICLQVPGFVISRTSLFPGKMFLVGLTGGIASGKSSVIQVFQQLGCAVIDVDVIARHVVQPGYPAHRRIVETFGTEVLLENGDINRKVLGDLIFNQPDRRQLLNAITHPEIQKEMMKETFKYFLRVTGTHSWCG